MASGSTNVGITPRAAPAKKRFDNMHVFMHITGMKFTWSEAKNRINIRKHGFDLSDAEKVFGGPMLIEEDACQTYDEKRFLGIGILEGRVVVVIVYAEPDDETTRFISMRKADSSEKKRFVKAIKN